MKYVVVPDPITFKGKDGQSVEVNTPEGGMKSTFAMYDFIMDNVCSSQDIGKGMEGMKRVRKLQRIFEDSVPGDLVGIEDADYTVVMKVVEGIQWVRPLLGVQLLPLMEALEDAAKHDEEWKKARSNHREITAVIVPS